jgi:hypothetical protein
MFQGGPEATGALDGRHFLCGEFLSDREILDHDARRGVAAHLLSSLRPGNVGHL